MAANHCNTDDLYRAIPGFPGYFVTRMGNVLSERHRRRDGRVVVRKQEVAPCGYLVVKLRKDNRNARRLVHRLVLEAFHGPCLSGLECRHIDGDKFHNAASNLQWATHAENMGDRAIHGTVPQGEKNTEAKLTEVDVRSIRKRYKRQSADQNIFTLANEFSVHYSTISSIVCRKTWRHI